MTNENYVPAPPVALTQLQPLSTWQSYTLKTFPTEEQVYAFFEVDYSSIP